MSVTVPIQSIELTPGSCISIDSLSWQDYENFLAERGKSRSRVAYYRGTLEIVFPLAFPERVHRIIASIVTAILEFQGRDWENFRSTTFKRDTIAVIEPDTCFYIENVVNLPSASCPLPPAFSYPPPDLAIESDVTSKTTLDAYLAIAVPEVWVYSEGKLKIYLLDGGVYREGTVSRIFPDLNLCERIPRLVNDAMERGTRMMLRELKESLGRSIP